MCNYLNKRTYFLLALSWGRMSICPERRQVTTSNQKVLLLENTLRVTLAVSQTSIKNKHWILGTHRAVSRSAAALMWPHRQSCQSARPCLWLIIALWAITDQRMDSCPWTKRPVCLYGRTPANLTVRPGRLPDFLRLSGAAPPARLSPPPSCCDAPLLPGWLAYLSYSTWTPPCLFLPAEQAWQSVLNDVRTSASTFKWEEQRAAWRRYIFLDLRQPHNVFKIEAIWYRPFIRFNPNPNYWM